MGVFVLSAFNLYHAGGSLGSVFPFPLVRPRGSTGACLDPNEIELEYVNVDGSTLAANVFARFSPDEGYPRRAIETYFVSRYASSPSCASSRPRPDSFIPPNGH